MSLPGLIDSVSVEVTPDGRRLADSATGAVLPLSEGELRLIEMWDGQSSAVELAAAAAVGVGVGEGVDVEAGQIEAFFSRMARIGVLGRAPPVVPGAVVPPLAVKVETDIVPTFRGDLRLEPAQGTRGIIHVMDPLSERVFTLYDFEVSIARMLNGRRSAHDVLLAADRIGVPLTLASLRAFIVQLRTFRFLDARPARTPTTWNPRRAWTDEVRDLYQQALKLARRGDRHEALSCLESVLELDPSNEDAMALNARLADTSGQPAIGTTFDMLHAKAPPELLGPALKPDYPLAQGGADPFEALDPVVNPAPRAPETVGKGPALWPVSEAPVSEAIESQAIESQAIESEAIEMTGGNLSLSQMRRKRTFWPMVGLAGALALGLAGLFFPVASIAKSACTVDLVDLAVLRAPSDGVVTFEAKSGQMVSVGQVVARMSRAAGGAGGNTSVAALEKRLAEAEAKEKKAKLLQAPAAKVAKVQKGLAQDMAQLDALVAQRAKVAGQKSPAAARRLAAFDRTIKAKEAAVAKERAALEDLTHPPALAALETTIAETKRELERARAGGETATDIIATQAGRLVVDPTPVGTLGGTAALDTVAKGTVVGRVVSTSLCVTTKRGAPPSGHATVKVGEERLEARVDGSRLYIEGASSLVGKPCTVSMQEGRRPWVLTLLQ